MACNFVLLRSRLTDSGCVPQALDPEVLLLQATFKDLCILVDLVGLHLAMVGHHPVDHHQIWDLPRVSMDPHHHVALLHPLTQGLRHPDRTL